MNKKKQFAKTTLIILFGKVCTQLISFFLLPLYTAYLSKSEYGIVDLIQTYVLLFVPIITLELEMSIFRYLIDSRDNEKNTEKLISNNFYVLGISLTLFTIIFFIVNCFVKIPFPFVIWIDIVVCVLSGNFLQIARGFGKTLDYSISCILTGITTVVSNILLICHFHMQAEGMIISMALANFIFSLYLFIKLQLFNKIKFKLVDYKLLKEMYQYSIPLVPNGISWWIVNVSDRTIITWIMGTAANGLYAISNKFPTIISSLTGIFNLSWSESAALNINSPERDEFFSDIANTVMKLFVALAAGMLACIPFVFPIMINSKYNGAYDYIPPLVLATVFNVGICLYSQIYLAKKLSKKVASTTIMGAIINILINILFIKQLGLYAAAFSTMIAYFIMFIYRHFDIKKYVNIQYDKLLLIRSIIIFIFIIWIYYSKEFYLHLIGLIVVVLYAIASNYKFLLGSYNTIKNKIKR